MGSVEARPRASPGTATTVAFVVAVLIGGANFVAVRISNTELEPFWGAGLRFSLASLGFLAFALWRRLSWPRGRDLALTVVYGLLAFTVGYALMYWALLRVTAGLAAVVLAAVPLVTPLLAALHRIEPVRPRHVIGALVALGGILIISVGPGGVVLPLSGLLAMAAATVTVGESVIVGKRISGAHPAITNAVAMPIGAAALLALSAVAGERWILPTETDVIWSLAYLVVLGSVALFVLFLLVVRAWTAAATSYAFVLFPVVTLFADAALGGEPLTMRSLLGAAVVMAAAWFGALAPQRGR